MPKSSAGGARGATHSLSRRSPQTTPTARLWRRLWPPSASRGRACTTFADQAVIAIENVRLFEAEQERTRELTESLAQQTATSEVLGVISSSPGELQPVFRAMLESATRICEAKFGSMYLREGD